MKREGRKIEWSTLKWLWLITGIVCLAVFHSYIIGNETAAFYDVGSDTKDQYLMWYNGIVNAIRDGSFSTWDFTNGFGVNTMGHPLTDLFLIPVYILGILFGPEHLASYMIYTQIAKIMLAGTACYFFLTEFSYGERAKLLASFMYAFNGYLTVWGQHYGLGMAVVLLPLLMMYIERALRIKRFSIGLCLVSALAICGGFYQGYMCMLGCGIYTCMRILMQEGEKVKQRLCSLFMVAGTMVLGVLMASFRLFASAAAQLSSSERLSSELPVWKRIFGGRALWGSAELKAVFYRLFSSNIYGNGEDVYLGPRNYYEDAQLFFSTLFIILLFQYLAAIRHQECSRKKKFLQYISAVGMASLVLVRATSVPFNGFYGPFFRHTFLMMPIFAVVSAVALEQIFKEKISMPALVLSGLLFTAVYMKAYRIFPNGVFYRNNAMLLCLTGIVMAVLIVLLGKRKIEKKLCYVLLVVMLMCNVASDTSLDYSPRVTLSKNHPVYYAQTYHSDTNEALEWLEEYDDTFYRVEKDYFSAASCLDSQAQDYRGISAYNSNQNANIKTMVDVLWPMMRNENDKNHMQFANTVWDNVLASLSGVKYVLSKAADFNVPGYTCIKQIGDVYIYQNLNTESVAKFFDKTITQEMFEEQKTAVNTSALLTDALIVEKEDAFTIDNSEIKGYEKKVISDILSEGKIEKKYEYKAGQGEEGPLIYRFLLNQERMAQYDTMNMEFNLEVSGRTEVKVRIDGQYEHTFVANKINKFYRLSLPVDAGEVVLEIANPTEDITLSKLQFYGYEEKQDFSEGAQITVDAPVKDNKITGSIRASKDGMVMLAVPVENGWSVYLNGEKQEILTGDYGFISFPVTAGDYELTAVFEAPYLNEGIAISVISLAVFLLLVWITLKNNHSARKEG